MTIKDILGWKVGFIRQMLMASLRSLAEMLEVALQSARRVNRVGMK